MHTVHLERPLAGWKMNNRVRHNVACLMKFVNHFVTWRSQEWSREIAVTASYRLANGSEWSV